MSGGPDLLAIADRVVAQARPGEALEVLVTDGSSKKIRAYDGAIEQLASAGTQGAGIRVIHDHKVGFAWAGSLDEDVLAETLAEARDNAEFAEPDEWAGLAEPDGVAVPALDLYRQALVDTPIEAQIDLVLELERLVRAGDPRITGVEDCTYYEGIGRHAIASTTGVRTEGASGDCVLGTEVLATEGDETQTGDGYQIGRVLDDLDLEWIAAEAVRRATQQLGATKPPTQRLTVVLDPQVTAQFLEILAETLSGEAVLKGYSLFAERLGDEVAMSGITIVDDPTDAAAFGATTLDDEGLAARRNVLVDQGRLVTFCHNAYTARRSGTRSTGSAVRAGFKSTPTVGCHAMTLVPGTSSAAELLAGVDDGVLVTSVSGLHSGVNPVSGDFSTGAEGLRIRNGQVGAPVREFTIASTLQRMLRDVQGIGNDVTHLPMAASGVTLVIGDVTVSGT